MAAKVPLAADADWERAVAAGLALSLSGRRGDEVTGSRMSLRWQRLIRYRESSRGCRIESPMFVEEVTALRVQRDHDDGR